MCDWGCQFTIGSQRLLGLLLFGRGSRGRSNRGRALDRASARLRLYDHVRPAQEHLHLQFQKSVAQSVKFALGIGGVVA